MDTDGPTAMPTNAEILTLTQWFSPAYPVGAFAYSHGLEAAVEAGVVTDSESLHEWLEQVLKYGTGASDCLFLCAAFRAMDARKIDEIDAQSRAFAPSKERLMEADLLGASFCNVTGEVWAQDLHGLTYPVAVGRAANLAKMPLDLTTEMFLQAFLSNLVSCAMRLIPLGQTGAQRMIREFLPLVSEVAQTQLAATLDDLSSSAFLADIWSMKHETQYSRMFRT